MTTPGAPRPAAKRQGFVRRGVAALSGARWALGQHRAVHALLKEDGLRATVAEPPTTERGSLRGARLALWARRASCLERSLILQRWWATRGIGFDVVVGVRNPQAQRGPLAHAWVDYFDRDWSHRFSEIRRIEPPDGLERWRPRNEREQRPR